MSQFRLSALSLLSAVAILAAPALAGAAKKAKPKPVTLTLTIENLTASSKAKAVKKLEKAIKKVKGVVSAKANKKKGELTVKHAPDTVVADIKGAVTSAGFKVVEPEEAPAEDPEPEPEPEGGEEAE